MRDTDKAQDHHITVERVDGQARLIGRRHFIQNTFDTILEEEWVVNWCILKQMTWHTSTHH